MKKNEKIKTNTVIISDIHLGSKGSRVKLLFETLEKISFKKLILLGDIFDSLDFTELEADHWELIMYFTKLSKKVKIRWVEGNHDQGLIKITSMLMGVKVYKKYSWRYNKEKYMAIHGHQFDRLIINNLVVSFFIKKAYSILQLLSPGKRKNIIGYMKEKSKGWLRLSEKIANSAITFARIYRAKYIFCGHTHLAMFKEKHNIKYYNSGCWTDSPSHLITIDKKGVDIVEID